MDGGTSETMKSKKLFFLSVLPVNQFMFYFSNTGASIFIVYDHNIILMPMPFLYTSTNIFYTFNSHDYLGKMHSFSRSYLTAYIKYEAEDKSDFWI